MKKKDIIQLIIIGILIIVLLVLVLGGNKNKNKSASFVNLGGRTFEQIMGEEVSEVHGLYARLEEETKNIKLRRSPFSQQHFVSITGPYLNGIFWDSQKPMAIINHRIVENGSRVKEYVVVNILKDRVILMDTKNNKEVQLKLFE